MSALVDAEDVAWFRVEDESVAGAVRRAAMHLAAEVGFESGRAGEVGIVATELCTNLVKHAATGTVALRRVRSGAMAGVELVAVDAGPGMADLRWSALDGNSTTGTLGIGIGAVERLWSNGDAHSVPGIGTVVVATLWPADGVPPTPVATLTRPMNGEEVCGDAVAVRQDGDRVVVLLADGLGHGPLAATASQEAVRAFHTAALTSPAAVLTRVHGALAGTRGAAVAVAEIDRVAGQVRFAGVGNVSTWIDDGEHRRSLLSQPGIVGAQSRKIREDTYDLPSGAMVVLHSDGLTDKWDLAKVAGLRRHTATLVAAALLRLAGVRHDDASVVVAT